MCSGAEEPRVASMSRLNIINSVIHHLVSTDLHINKLVYYNKYSTNFF